MKLSDDDFTLFGLPPRFQVDRGTVDARWRALQAEVHPDRFVADGAAAQRVAMQWAMRINEAYRRLKDPMLRGAMLCEMRGAPIAAESNTAMPAAFLGRQMEWREALEAAADGPAVQALDDEVRRHQGELIQEIGELLDVQGNAASAAERVRALMFIVRFRADVEARLEALEA
jgi:molecular chaperone HscB